MRTVLCAVASLCAFAASALADNATVPAANAAAPGGTGTNTLLRETGNPRTFQMVIGAAAMGDIPPGSIITALTFRLQPDGGGAFPPASATYTQYDITLASSLNSPGGMSATFASNDNVDAVVVRSGSLTFNGSSFPGSATNPAVNGWGPRINFTTPFLWTGANLVVTIRHSGSNLPSGQTDFVDCLSTTDALAAGLQAQSATTAGAAVATTLSASCPIFRFDFLPPTQVSKAYVPRSSASDEGGTNFAPIGLSSAQTVQLVLGARELACVPPGSRITGISWRLNSGGVPWPTGAASWTQFDVSLSQSATAPGSMDSTIANNIGADAVVCRSGPLTLASGAYTGGETPNDFGAVIPFTTPYVYNGGNVHVVIRHSAFAGVSGTFDAVASSPDVQAGFAASAAALSTSTNAVIPVTRLSYIAGEVTPDVSADVAGSATYSGPIHTGTAKYQLLLGSEELASIPVGSTIDGLSFRLRPTAPSAWPAGGDAWFSTYTVELAPAATTPATMSTIFANNIGAGGIIVRQGPLVIPAGSFPSGPGAPTANPWGPVIRFTQPFVYPGGSLVLTITHGGQNRPFESCDAVATSDPDTGVRFRAVGNFSGAATGAYSNFAPVRFSFTPSNTAPASVASTDANSSTGLALLQVDQSVQTIIAESELLNIPVGSTIDGISYRRNASFTNGPARDLPSGSYTMQLGTAANTPATMSLTFAVNVGVGAVTVYDAPLTAPAYSMIGGLASVGQPNFVYFPFTRPFIYPGGPLAVTLRYTGATGGADQLIVDGLSTGGAGYATTIRTIAGNGTGAAVGSFTTAPIPRLAFTPPRCFADFNGDGFVDAIDYDIFIGLFLTSSPRADVNNDQFTDALDYDVYIAAFLSGC